MSSGPQMAAVAAMDGRVDDSGPDGTSLALEAWLNYRVTCWDQLPGSRGDVQLRQGATTWVVHARERNTFFEVQTVSDAHEVLEAGSARVRSKSAPATMVASKASGGRAVPLKPSQQEDEASGLPVVPLCKAPAAVQSAIYMSANADEAPSRSEQEAVRLPVPPRRKPVAASTTCRVAVSSPETQPKQPPVVVLPNSAVPRRNLAAAAASSPQRTCVPMVTATLGPDTTPSTTSSSCDHERRPARPCKGKRARLRKLQERLLEGLRPWTCEGAMPTAVDLSGFDLPPSVVSDPSLRAKLERKILLRLQSQCSDAYGYPVFA